MKTTEYAREPAGKLTPAELDGILRRANAPQVEKTCALCGRPQARLYACSGCGAGCWAALEHAYGPEMIAEMRKLARRSLDEGGRFTPEQVAAAVGHAYAPAGCRVCMDCWEETVQPGAYATCPLYLLAECRMNAGEAAPWTVIRATLGRGGKADRLTSLLRQIFGKWTDGRPAEMAGWRKALLRGALREGVSREASHAG